MNVETLTNLIGADFYTGVPDSQLKALCNYLMHTYGIDPAHHIIAANEGNCTALAAGYHLATGKVPVVYLQNSGEGNIINPVASLLNDKVYAIPTVFIVGWRGEPGVHDEPQHIYQGEVTLKLLEDMDISAFVISPDTTEAEVATVMERYRGLLAQGKSVAFVIRKGGLTFNQPVDYHNDNQMKREEIIRHILAVSQDDPIISTTGKASRELFELREQRGEDHRRDFLTVGSMGHSSSITLGAALQMPHKRFWCIDGDGAALMHMGAMAVIGAAHPENFIHVVINNGAHETVGGMPTVAAQIDFCQVARACGYNWVGHADDFDTLDQLLHTAATTSGPCFLEVTCAIGAREDLGRPTISALKCKENFMHFLQE